MSEHLARHALEELVIDQARIAPELRLHLADCEHCSRRLRGMEHARAQHALEYPAGHFARLVTKAAAARHAPARPRLHWRWALFGGTLTLAIAAAALAWLMPSKPVIRYRGSGISLQAYVRSGTGSRELHQGEALSAGAQLAFTYTVAEPQHLLLFGVDDGGTITRYFPDGNIARSSALSAGATRQLPVGIELDARRGHERLIALFSETVLDEARARAAIETAWREARARGKSVTEPFELPVPARQISLWFDRP
jgi:hypothetical protein